MYVLVILKCSCSSYSIQQCVVRNAVFVQMADEDMSLSEYLHHQLVVIRKKTKAATAKAAKYKDWPAKVIGYDKEKDILLVQYLVVQGRPSKHKEQTPLTELVKLDT